MKYFDARRLVDSQKMKIDFFRDIVKDLDGKIPQDIAEMLIRENNNPDYTILIHRTAKHPAEYFFSNGLPIAGGNDLEYTTSRYQDNLSLFLNLKDAGKYKNPFKEPAICLIMKIPNEYLKYEPGKTKPILFQTDMLAEESGGMMVQEGKFQTVLLPEFILGAVTFEQGRITGYLPCDNYRNIHDYQNDGLVCAAETIYSYPDKKGEFVKISSLEDYFNREEEIKQKYEMINATIIAQNNEYMKAHPVSLQVKRTEQQVKTYSQKEMKTSRFINALQSLRDFVLGNKENNKDGRDK